MSGMLMNSQGYNIIIKIINTDEDISLLKRTEIINKIYNDYKNKYFVYLFSIHGNAFDNNEVNGVEAFTSVGNTKADIIADTVLKELETLGWNMRFNNKNKLGKESNFFILKNTKCPSVLTENGFYTNEVECSKMLHTYWRSRIAMCHVSTAIKIELDNTIK